MNLSLKSGALLLPSQRTKPFGMFPVLPNHKIIIPVINDSIPLNPDPLPEILVTVNVFVEGLYVRLVSTLIFSLPDDESTKVKKCDELSFVAVTPTSAAAPAESEPAFIQAVSVPSDDST